MAIAVKVECLVFWATNKFKEDERKIMSTIQNLRWLKRTYWFYSLVCVLLAFGMHSVLLFSQQLNYFNVSQSAGNSSNSRICFDSSNNLYVVWQDSTSIIRYRFFNKQSWSNIYEIYNSDTSSVLGVGITSFRDTCYVFCSASDGIGIFLRIY